MSPPVRCPHGAFAESAYVCEYTSARAESTEHSRRRREFLPNVNEIAQSENENALAARLCAAGSAGGGRWAVAFFVKGDPSELAATLQGWESAGAAFDGPMGLRERLIRPIPAKEGGRRHSRAALEMALRSLGPPAPGCLGLTLAHTGDAAIAAARLAEPGHRAVIGIDLERLDRAVSARLVERFAHPEDVLDGLPSIGAWAAKEAAYKAAGPFAFRQLRLTLARSGGDVWRGHAAVGRSSITLAVAQSDTFIAALAWPE